MQNWSDQSLARLPGYRDRIAHVGLVPEEGGLNLDMPPERIADLSLRGENAGREFVSRFVPGSDAPMNWENHRWLRLRSLLASLEEMCVRIDRSCAEPGAGDPPFSDWLAADEPPPSYPWHSGEQRHRAARTLRALRAIGRLWSRPPRPTKPPAPPPAARPAPVPSCARGHGSEPRRPPATAARAQALRRRASRPERHRRSGWVPRTGLAKELRPAPARRLDSPPALGTVWVLGSEPA